MGVFVGNAWDPQDGRETPWIDIARQIAGDQGVARLGPAAKTTPPGTEAIGRLFDAACGVVLILFDEVLNFLNRHRGMADAFHAFIQNLTGSVARSGIRIDLLHEEGKRGRATFLPKEAAERYLEKTKDPRLAEVGNPAVLSDRFALLI